MLDLNFLYGTPKKKIEIPKGRRCGRCRFTDEEGKKTCARGEYRKVRTILTKEMKKSAKPMAIRLLKQGHQIKVIYRQLINSGELTNEKGNHPGYNSVCEWLKWVKMDNKIPDPVPIYKQVEELQKQGMTNAEVAKKLNIRPIVVRRARERIKKHANGFFDKGKKDLTQAQKTG